MAKIRLIARGVASVVAEAMGPLARWLSSRLSFWHYREDARDVDTIVEHPSGEIVDIAVKASATVIRDRVGARLRAWTAVHVASCVVPQVTARGRQGARRPRAFS